MNADSTNPTIMFPRGLLMIGICSMLFACRSQTTAPEAETGARQVVIAYFEALAHQDWHAAYQQLHPDTQKSIDRAAFERRARVYCKRLEFPIGKVLVRSCDEQGEKAVAQVILTDVAGSMKHRFREGAILQQAPGGWRLVLPSNFGQK